jgi:glycosyltransferase involved in cell wall biosynthesis
LTLFKVDAAAAASPANHWLRLEGVLICLRQDMTAEAQRRLEAVSGSPQIPPEVLETYRAMIAAALRPDHHPPTVPAPLPTLSRNRAVPAGFPIDMVLPKPLGANDFTGFAAWTGPPDPSRLHIIAQVDTTDQATALGAVLGRANTSESRLSLSIFAPQSLAPVSMPIPTRWQVGKPWQLPRDQQIVQFTGDADALLFLGAGTLPDVGLPGRVLHACNQADTLILPLAALSALATPSATVLSNRLIHHPWITHPAPYRNITSLNFAVSANTFRKLAGLDPRFASEAACATEFAFRVWNSGGYVMPVAIDGPVSRSNAPTAKDSATLRQLCPPLRDAASTGRFEVPKVSIYIPAYRASRYLSQAIDSVLLQNFEDLEICIADDGSPDKTRQLLEARYGQDPRLRWISGRNGGIGAASNAAVGMARGLYVGQLDADDCLKPGAIRRLVSYLDDHPDIGCAYSSCERVDADGAYLHDEYSFPTFSPEKLLLTSIVHHFRMFRRQTWGRTAGFRTDIANAVDYDIFLKMAEVAPFHHIDEVLYQRRWHGGNTSQVRGVEQGRNTHFVQQRALDRMGLAPHWALHAPDPEAPRKVQYQRQTPRVFFWPDYSRHNPYQRLLYASARHRAEFIAADIDTVLDVLADDPGDPGMTTFHLHWLNKLTDQARSADEAKALTDAFLAKLHRLKALGGRLIWTVHNTLSHDTAWPSVETNLAQGIIALADHVHLHSAASIPEVSAVFPIPDDKLRILPHGAYTGCYPDYVSRKGARAALGLSASDDVILFLGQIRPYKGVEALLTAFNKVQRDRPDALLLVAGQIKDDLRGAFDAMLGNHAQPRVRLFNRFIDDAELQLFFGAADFAVFPYRRVLTSGSAIASLGFGVPVVAPDVGMTRELLGGRNAGLLYDPSDAAGLERTMQQMLGLKDQDRLAAMGKAARAHAAALSWQDFGQML